MGFPLQKFLSSEIEKHEIRKWTSLDFNRMLGDQLKIGDENAGYFLLIFQPELDEFPILIS